MGGQAPNPNMDARARVCQMPAMSRPIADIPFHPNVPNTHGIELVWEGFAFAKAMA